MKKVAPIAFAAAAFAGAPPAASEDLGVRVQPGGLAALEDAVTAMVPDEIVLEDVETDAVCNPYIEEATILTELEEVELRADSGTLRAEVVLDLAADAQVEVCSELCDVSARAAPVSATLELALGTSADDWLAVEDAEVELSLSAGRFGVEAEGCSAGAFLSAIDEWLLDLVGPLAEDFVGSRLADRIGEVLSESLPRRVETDDLAAEGYLSRLDITPERGVDVAGGVAFSSVGADRDAPETSSPLGDPLPLEFGPGDFAFAASDRLVTTALYEAWQAGLLELALEDIAPTIPLSEEGFGQQLGLPEGAEIELGIDFGAAPEASFGRFGEEVSILFEDLIIEVGVAPPGVRPAVIEIAADAHLRAAASVSGDGALVLDPKELDIKSLIVTGESSDIAADPARLGAFVEDVGVPLLTDLLADLPIAPALRPTDDLYVWMRHIEADRGWLRTGIDLVVPDASDTSPPSTRLVDPPDVLPAGLSRIAVTGEDDTTPTPLLRYHATLDGQPITAEPALGGTIPVSASDGVHTLEVYAIDLAGNVDPDPVTHEIVVDGVPPELDVLDAPEHTVGDAASASWRATDDRGVVTTTWELLEVGSGGSAEQTGRQGEAGAEGEVELTDLDSGMNYILRITAVDEAGNVTSEDLGFGSVQGGCSAAGGAAPASLLVVLAALAVLLVRRRARIGPIAAVAVTAVAVTALPSSASAQFVGTHFSGPTDADGASAFWNPAAMLRGDENQIDAASGLSLLRIRYDAAQGERSSTFAPRPEPSLGGYTRETGEDWRLGLTFAVPEISGAIWSRDDGAGDVTRYYATSARYYHITATPAVAYKAHPWLSVGGGVRLVRSQMIAGIDQDIGSELNMTLGSSDPDAPLPYAEPALAAPTELRASGWGVGLAAGALVTPPAPVTLGVGIQSPSTSRASGEVSAEYPEQMRQFIDESGVDADLPDLEGAIEADLKLPLMVFSAVAVEPEPGWEVVADYRFIRRSQAPNTDLVVSESTSPSVDDTAVVRGYNNRHSVGVRASRDFEAKGLLAALRIRYESSSVPEETLSPSNLDFHKVELGAAAAYSLSDRVDVIGQYSRYILARQRVTSSLNGPVAEPSLAAFNKPSPTGEYSGASDYLAFGVSTYW